jgi:ABC-2 type transport system permease protein
VNTRTNTLRIGLERGRIEFRQSVTSGQELWGILFFPVITLIIMLVLRGNTVPGMAFSLSTYSIPGILGINVVLNGMMSLALALSTDREDGTLLRAKAMPNGVPSYLTGKVLARAGIAIVGLLVPLVPAAFLFDGMDLGNLGSWLTLTWVLALGLVAVLPIGACLGSLFANPQSIGFVTVPIMLVMGISGVFYPIGGFPGWLQWIAQFFPFYWLGLGLRSAMLPDSLAAAEVGGSWDHLDTVVVLLVWALIGLVLAPWLLRRMAGRESGAALSTRRQRAMQRTM